MRCARRPLIAAAALLLVVGVGVGGPSLRSSHRGAEALGPAKPVLAPALAPLHDLSVDLAGWAGGGARTPVPFAPVVSLAGSAWALILLGRWRARSQLGAPSIDRWRWPMRRGPPAASPA